MFKIELPRLVGTREAATELLEQKQIPVELAGADVYILGRSLATSTISFADELLKQLSARHAGDIILVGTPGRFENDIKNAAARRKLDSVRLGTQQDVALF
ncbi:hypothetical protein NVV95_11195 [Herbiconiux sp. CPCC 205716]|uniref:Uncharacterized protein n=1 Tax=Herbiconiux gentiana TaxID=2970912 RepID=A0ABT2GFW9_9MICO|nr:hypothetical protein [Herbiconiux gentiana]MCS5715117.1 hypothetical protein [Herbiconiux gentiana]